MKTLVFFLTTVIALSLTVSSCKKYEDGPRFSLASKKGRVANTWKYEKIYKNGREESITSSDLNYRIKLDKEGNATVSTSNGSTTTSVSGTWEFIDDKEEIRTTFTTTFIITTTTITDYKILRLKQKELWVEETDSNGDKYEYHFVEA